MEETTFEGFLQQIVQNWAYFLGYGLPLGLLSQLFPHFIGWGGILLAVGYPWLVIGAMGSQWRPAQLNSTGDWFILTLLRQVLIVSMRPALFVSNRICQFVGWIVYHCWFRSSQLEAMGFRRPC